MPNPKKKQSKPMFIRIGERWRNLLKNAALTLDLPQSTIEREFHEDYFIKFLETKGLTVLRDEVFPK